MILKLKRTPGIYLVGFMGCGKTTIGRQLAEQIGWYFVDLDVEIESERNMSIAEIFERQGEEKFREIEAEIMSKHLKAVAAGRPMVMALGGGVFTQQTNRELLNERGITVWLDCPLALVEERVSGQQHRPLARDVQRMRQLYEERRSAYEQADYRIEVTGNDPSIPVNAIVNLPLF